MIGESAQADPIVRFLGADASGGGPFALLDVSPDACTDELVIAALERQIERIAQHPQADTPEADEVRLALHASAAQLLDPGVRERLVERWRPVTPSRSRVAPPPAPGAEPAPTSARTLLEHDVLLSLGLAGGWNKHALRHLVWLAHARGFSSVEVADALRAMATMRVARPAAALAAPGAMARGSRAARVGAAPLPEQIDPGARALKMALFWASLALLGVSLAALAIVLGTRPSGREPPAQPPIAQRDPAPTPPTPAPPPTIEQPPARSTIRPALDLPKLRVDLAACVEGLAVDPAAAIERFKRTTADLGSHWCLLTRGELIATQDLVLEFFYRSSPWPDLATQAVEAIGAPSAWLGDASAPPGDTWSATWSVGMLVRLGAERELTSSARAATDRALGTALGFSRAAVDPTFDAGASVAHERAGRRLAQARESSATRAAWDRWARAAGAIGAGSAAIENRLLLSGLESVLLLGPDPTRSRDTFDIIERLVERVAWRKGDDSRRWLLRWLSDRRLTSGDLHAVTTALATRSAAEGVDISMVLSATGTDRDRAGLRERYARAWGLTDTLDREMVSAAWIAAARRALDESGRGGSAGELLRHGVVLARINEAASWRWRGEDVEAAWILDNLEPPAPTGERASALLKQMLRPDEPAGRGVWAERYLGARRSTALRLELLHQLAIGARDLGSVDAEVLCEEAFTGSPAEVRNQAHEVVRRFADSPAVIGAVLEMLPRLRVDRMSAELVVMMAARPLPSRESETWGLEARRALVERLLELTAGEGELADIDRLSALMAMSYRSRAAQRPLSSAEREGSLQPTAIESVRLLWLALRTEAEQLPPGHPGPMSVEVIERRRAGRVGLATGLVQAFAAEQVSACELLAHVVIGERPDRVERVSAVLDDLERARRRADSVVEQILEVERATARLWIIRGEEERS